MCIRDSPDDAADIIRDLPYEKAETLLRLMGVEDAAEIRSLLGYKDDTAGGMMTTQFVAMKETDTVLDTVEVLRALDEDFPTVHFVYVLEEDSEKLVGVLSMRTLVLAHRESQLKDIMYTEIISVPVSYTHLDVYKRQAVRFEEEELQVGQDFEVHLQRRSQRQAHG